VADQHHIFAFAAGAGDLLAAGRNALLDRQGSEIAGLVKPSGHADRHDAYRRACQAQRGNGVVPTARVV